MSRIVLSMMTSLDGAVARADGDLNWFLTDEEFEATMLAQLDRTEAILLGRVAYELLAAFWPRAGSGEVSDEAGGFTSPERERAFAERLNRIPKVVYSRTLREAAWGPATIVREPIAEDLAERKTGARGDLVLFGGAALAAEFVRRDFVDNYQLLVHPIVLGRSLPLFDGLVAERRLRRVRAASFPSGIVFLEYDRDRTG